MAATTSPARSSRASPSSSSARSRSSSSAPGRPRTRSALADLCAAGRRRLLPPRSAHQSSTRRAPRNSSAAAQARRPRWPRRQVSRRRRSPRRSRAIPEGDVHHGRPVARQPHADHRARRRLPPGRDRGDRRGREAARHGGAHGRCALRRRGGGSRCVAGRADVAGRASTCSPSAAPRTAASPPRRWSSSTRRMRATSASPASAPGTASRRPGSSPRSSTPISRDGHWLELARHANAMGARLARRSARVGSGAACAASRRPTRSSPSCRRRGRAPAQGGGRVYHPWSADSLPPDERPGPDEVIVRLVDELADDGGRGRPLRRAARRGLSPERKGRPGGAPFDSAQAGSRGGYAATLASICFDLRLAAADGDRAGLHRLGNLADEIDVEEAVLEARALHLDVVGELEAALEGAGGDAAIEDLACLRPRFGLFFSPRDGERVLLRPRS